MLTAIVAIIVVAAIVTGAVVTFMTPMGQHNVVQTTTAGKSVTLKLNDNISLKEQ
jgi:dolichol kinase